MSRSASIRAPVIVDTNVLVAGLLTNRDDSPVAQVPDGMLRASFAFVVSEALLAEYRSVLVRPGLRMLHGLTVADVDTILTDIAQHAIVLQPVTAPAAPDPGDQMLWELLVARPELRLITGDKLLLADAGMAGRVISPQQFLAAG